VESIPSPSPLGSPPRTWGILDVKIQLGHEVRFTPTHVGNTLQVRLGYREVSVHPHARGEYVPSVDRRLAHFGSPPRTWGIRKATTLLGASQRGKKLANFPHRAVSLLADFAIAAGLLLAGWGSRPWNTPRAWGLKPIAGAPAA
jgi:hypothetical protein